VRKFDVVMLAAILLTAAVLRVWAPWDDVFGAARVNFLETDAWYRAPGREPGHNFHIASPSIHAAPNRVRRGGTAPRYRHRHHRVHQGRDAWRSIERVAALVPGDRGVLAVLAVGARDVAFDRRAGLIAQACSLRFCRDTFDRTLIGFVDHHALEVLLSFATLAIASAEAIGAGIALGCICAWASGSSRLHPRH
jgi:asparagine N-glycosylation enzyme membrane subunit Stt3